MEPENVAVLFDLSDMAATICLTTSPDMAKGIYRVGDRCAWISGRGR